MREIDYEALAQEAMRGVVRTVLSRVVKSGLPGEHHFFIAFNTQAPGVSLSKRLKEQYPDEMTIVLQHRFWDLIVHDDRFEVKLTFDHVPERLSIPYSAIKVFFDPSVPYGLQFEASEFGSEPRRTIGLAPKEGETGEPTTGTPRDASSPMPARPAPGEKTAPPRRERAPKKPKTATDKPAAERPLKPVAKPAEPRLVPPPEPAAAPGAATGEANDSGAGPRPASGPGGKVVSLDQFRKK